jgi:ectoine hydroxylase-related dioxygenase (phytanoyl-CoA dioxygenase family)
MQPTFLSDAQISSWNKNGFVVVKSAVAKEFAADTAAAVWNYLGMDKNKSQDWYDKELRDQAGIDYRGMIPFYHHQSLWNCRQSPAIYQAFADLYGSTKLLVSLDRVNMNPPATDGWNYKGFIHWDLDVTLNPIPFQLQGVLALSDTGRADGGFQCVRGFHLKVGNWVRQQPSGWTYKNADFSDLKTSYIAMKAGDLLIWNSVLPHGNSVNHSSGPRLAQYITMFPAEGITDTELKSRVQSFENNTPPFYEGNRQFPISPKTFFEEPVELTDLGKKILGINPWL